MNLQEIRRRISSVKNTQKITRAMKMVAASKLRRAQEAIRRTRPYAHNMGDLTTILASRAEPDKHPLLQPGSGGAAGLVVVTSDRGLCGGFNGNIINETMRIIHEEFAGTPVELIVVGRKGVDAFKRRNVTVCRTFPGLFDRFSVSSASSVVDDFVPRFTSGEFREVYCVYNEFKTALSQRVVLERLLPYPSLETAETPPVDYIFEPSEDQLLFQLLVNNIYVQMYRILHESAASEHSARMRSMDSATRNAGEIIGKLTLTYNKERQAEITREVTEVISAAEAVG
ncbi:MAG: ATP synthase F1 subunit gamma [Candidatus Hydrogenedentes bacterium]|nr:ATP synthase F1 subunit gamma [Candidatus Hydrogenedentota bacterium]